MKWLGWKAALLGSFIIDFLTMQGQCTLGVSINQTCQGNSGVLCANVTGGTPPYMYTWTDPNGDPAGSTQCITVTATGEYDVAVVDAQSCGGGAITTFNGCGASGIEDVNGALRPFTYKKIDNYLLIQPLERISVVVYDNTGKVLYSKPSTAETIRIPAEILTNRVYTIVISNEKDYFLIKDIN